VHKNEDDITPTFRIFPERWTCAIEHGTPLMDYELERRLLSAGRDTDVDHAHDTMYIYDGDWKFAKNFLTPKVMTPILWRIWRNRMNIEDLVAYQDYRVAKGHPHPISLIWYPRKKEPSTPSPLVAPTDSVSNINTTVEAPVPLDLAASGAVSNTLATAQHKRMISDAIPSTERPNGSEQVEEAEPGDIGDAERGNDEGDPPRRSGRARKTTRKAKGPK
jgi:hypothetical protein